MNNLQLKWHGQQVSLRVSMAGSLLTVGERRINLSRVNALGVDRVNRDHPTRLSFLLPGYEIVLTNISSIREIYHGPDTPDPYSEDEDDSYWLPGYKITVRELTNDDL